MIGMDFTLRERRATKNEEGVMGTRLERRGSTMNRIGLLIGIVVLLGVVLSPFVCNVMVWDGHFKLNATIRSRSSQPIKQ